MTNYYHGLNCRWSLNGITQTVFGASALIQNTKATDKMAKFTAANQLGNTAVVVMYDEQKGASITWYAATSGSLDGNAIGTRPSVGSMITLTDTIDSGSIINGTNWIVDDVDEDRAVTDAMKYTCNATAYVGITS